MSAYEGFSKVYDKFMEDAPYDDWINYLKKIWEKYSLSPRLIAELGCGTGNITERLADMGYDMIGIDSSENMLSKAREKTGKNKAEVLYLNQDMRDFELYGTVDCVISLCDSINYITEYDDLLKVFKLVNNYLDPKGLFIFDLNTIYKFKNILGQNSFSQTDESSACTWENYFDENESINEYYTNFFIKDDKTGLYERFEEEHYERGYTIAEIKKIIEESGLEFVAVFDEMTFSPPKDNSERIFFVAREKEK
ncbi:MAG: class I SAM-dependent methyltransferase [Clostridiales bacterium]|nr:class I SAM-dependent methyltransferase [Clostridiales bacterium]